MSETATPTQQQYMSDAQVRELLDGYGLSKSSEVANVDAKVDSLSQSVAANAQRLDALAAASAEGSETVVSVSDAQWAEMRDCWLHAKASMSVGLFLALVLTLLCAAVLGSRLWADFSRGWRH